MTRARTVQADSSLISLVIDEHRRKVDPLGAGLEDLADLMAGLDERITLAHRLHFRGDVTSEKTRSIRRNLTLAHLRSRQVNDLIVQLLEFA